MNDAQTIVTGIVSVIGSALVAWLTSRSSRAATAEMAKVQNRQTDIDGMDRLVHNLEARLGKVEAELERVETEAAQLHDRVRTLEQERTRDRALIRHLISYVNVLREALRAANLTVPNAPGGLDLDGGILS